MSVLSILVVEDDEGVQSLLRRLLTQGGHQVTVVGNGQDAIRVAQEIPVHVLLTDLKLPDIDGLAVLERILQIDPKVLGIVMTGYGSIDVAIKAMKVGAFDFLTKPFDSEVVVASINKALEAHRRSQDTRGQSIPFLVEIPKRPRCSHHAMRVPSMRSAFPIVACRAARNCGRWR